MFLFLACQRAGHKFQSWNFVKVYTKGICLMGPKSTPEGFSNDTSSDKRLHVNMIQPPCVCAQKHCSTYEMFIKGFAFSLCYLKKIIFFFLLLFIYLTDNNVTEIRHKVNRPMPYFSWFCNVLFHPAWPTFHLSYFKRDRERRKLFFGGAWTIGFTFSVNWLTESNSLNTDHRLSLLQAGLRVQERNNSLLVTWSTEQVNCLSVRLQS